MKLDDFDFDLPQELIALRPAVPRSSARLLVAQGGAIADHHFTDLAQFLRPGDRLVLNDTKVVPARLQGVRERIMDGDILRAKVEVTLTQPQGDGVWSVLARPLKKLRVGDRVRFGEGLTAECTDRQAASATLRFDAVGDQLDDAIDAVGRIPLPPYIDTKRPADDQDKDDYQTIWAKHRGAVAAPTASLHFDDGVLAALAAREVEFSFVTLHVGAGTFLPVQVEDVKSHKMHAEWGEITPEAAAEINATRAAGGRIIPVGTTALRLVESAAEDGRVRPWTGDTDIFIYPGFQFQIAAGLITNFHLPKSTLMMLVSALMGKDQIDRIYAHAIAQKYRFFSYGDGSLLLP